MRSAEDKSDEITKLSDSNIAKTEFPHIIECHYLSFRRCKDTVGLCTCMTQKAFALLGIHFYPIYEHFYRKVQSRHCVKSDA